MSNIIQTIDATTPKTVEEYLDEVDYGFINTAYQPTTFSLKFIQFVKNIVNDGKGDTHPTPNTHLVMLDQLTSKKSHHINLAYRGSAKTSVFAEYLFLYVAVFGGIDGFGSIDGALYVSDSMENGAKNLRKNIETRFNNSVTLQSLMDKAVFTDNFLEFTNVNKKKFGVKLFGAQTGLRGTKIYAKRPKLAILDDLIKDSDADSPASMAKIVETVYAGVEHALDPTKKKVIFNGTPFNKKDVLYQAAESGGWTTSAFPICERFPCERDEFRGAWEERFDYDYVKEQYDFAKANGKLDSFYKELMLRITSDEEKLVDVNNINFYDKTSIIANIGAYTFAITTDFATSKNQHSNYSVIYVWAFDKHNNIFLFDGYVGKSEMDVNIDILFKFAEKYKPFSVGVEVSGQQKGFVNWIQKEQYARNIFFNFASSNKKTFTAGIVSISDKLTRFKMILPVFNLNRIFFPREHINDLFIKEALEELNLITQTGIKSKYDDALDAISMLQQIDAILPAQEPPILFNTTSKTWQQQYLEQGIDFDEEYYDNALDDQYIV